MDPNEALKTALKALARMNRAGDAGHEMVYFNAAVDVAESFEELHEWLKGGGFLPAEWNHGAVIIREPRWNPED